jgi:hypothetical protein
MPVVLGLCCFLPLLFSSKKPLATAELLRPSLSAAGGGSDDASQKDNLEPESKDTPLRGPSRDHHWTTVECAAYLGVSHPHLEHLRCRGDGPPFYKLGKSVRYIPDIVDDWAHAQLTGSTSDPIRTPKGGGGRPMKNGVVKVAAYLAAHIYHTREIQQPALIAAAEEYALRLPKKDRIGTTTITGIVREVCSLIDGYAA